jgi:hypothetical protein
MLDYAARERGQWPQAIAHNCSIMLNGRTATVNPGWRPKPR